MSVVLIANRGEIAVRIARTASAMGWRTVAVYSNADAGSAHVRACDQAVSLGGQTAQESYLRIDAIIDAARTSGATHIHPGFGFLSENADFVSACDEAGLIFVGPLAKSMELMGNKRASKIAMLAADVPCVPGIQQDGGITLEQAIEAAKDIGYPILLKAAAGGGGRGMRLVTQEADMQDAWDSAIREAEKAFGNGEMLLEKAIQQPRHIEIQVFGDSHGNIIHLGERDCSVQRRHQKVVEESPSPLLPDEVRQAMGAAAVRAAQACDYVGAGTVEFIADKDDNFYFLEMNTRLQVEHPVTEMVTGVDLVAWQLQIASGERLPMTQEMVVSHGHAIEVRLYAEDPEEGFMPQAGPIHVYEHGDDIRFDDGVATGDVISPFYDPMIAKVIAHGSTRADALRKLDRALAETVLLGTRHNRDFLRDVLASEPFQAGKATTALIAEEFGETPSSRTRSRAEEAAVVGALAAIAAANAAPVSVLDFPHLEPAPDMLTYVLSDGQEQYRVRVAYSPLGVIASCGDEQVELDNPDCDGYTITADVDGMSQRFAYTSADNQHFAHLPYNCIWFDETYKPPTVEEGADGIVRAPMDGKVVQVAVKDGQSVTKGDLLVVLEAMKLEQPFIAVADGTVNTVHVEAGQQVQTRQVMIEIDVEATADE